MTFLDSSTIIEYLRDNQTVIDYLDKREPWWTSTICVFEVLNGPAGIPNFDPREEQQRKTGVNTVILTSTRGRSTGSPTSSNTKPR